MRGLWRKTDGETHLAGDKVERETMLSCAFRKVGRLPSCVAAALPGLCWGREQNSLWWKRFPTIFLSVLKVHLPKRWAHWVIDWARELAFPSGPPVSYLYRGAGDMRTMLWVLCGSQRICMVTCGCPKLTFFIVVCLFVCVLSFHLFVFF